MADPSQKHGGSIDDAVHRFLVDEVDTVPEIEALLLIWESRPKHWTAEELAERLFVDIGTVRSILAKLAKRQLITAGPERPALYSFQPRSPEADGLIEAVATAYRRDLVRATTIIHSKASQAVREFARAFRLTKDGN